MKNPLAISRIALSAGLLSIFASTMLIAGPINPPAGVVAPSFKTLSEVEPRIAINATNTPGDADSMFKITQPGSYYLTENVLGVSGKSGIEISNYGVTIDLNGFELAGVPGSLFGIKVTIQGHRVTVRNGTVRNWGQDGVNIAPATGTSVVDVIAENNGNHGIYVGSIATISNCIANSNTGSGIYSLDACVVTHCTTNSNTLSGIVTFSGSTVSDCSSTSNHDNNFEVQNGCTITRCSASHATVDGINAGSFNTISDNTCFANGDDGIEAVNSCTISRNTCSNNDPNGDGGGVYIQGNANRIEDNQVSGNNKGILCVGADNFIVKNTSHGNIAANFGVNSGNEFAPVITNPGSNSFATMTPWSNVAY